MLQVSTVACVHQFPSGASIHLPRTAWLPRRAGQRLATRQMPHELMACNVAEHNTYSAQCAVQLASNIARSHSKCVSEECGGLGGGVVG